MFKYLATSLDVVDTKGIVMMTLLLLLVNLDLYQRNVMVSRIQKCGRLNKPILQNMYLHDCVCCNLKVILIAFFVI